MKCPKCKLNHKKRYGMRHVCGYEFVFNPAENAGLTDGKFLAAVTLASANDTYYFTANQLYTALCRRMCGSGRLIFVLFFSGAALVALILRLLAVLDTFNLVCIGVMLLFACATTISHVFAAPPSRDRFDAALDAWIRAKGPIEKLIVEPRLSVAPPDYPEKDIYDYGVQRLLIVQHDLLVDLFVLNNFHAEEQTLVMSAGGYPAYVARRAAEILRGSRDLTVYLLHDATDEGMRMSVAQLPSLDQHQVIELGLFPDDVRLLRALRPIRPARRGYRVPVDSIPYKRLAALLTAAITARTPLAEVLRARVAGNGDTIGGAGFG